MSTTELHDTLISIARSTGFQRDTILLLESLDRIQTIKEQLAKGVDKNGR